MFFCYIKFFQLLIELLIISFCYQGWESSTIPFQIDASGTRILNTDNFCHSLWVVVLSFAILGGAALHLSPPTGFCLGFILVRELQLSQMSFDPLPSLPRNTLLRVTSREFPLMLMWVVLCKHILPSAKCILLYTAPCLKVVYNQAKICKQTCRSTCASWMLVGLVSVNNPKFQYLQGSWFLVVQMLHLTGAGWLGLLCVLLLADGAGVREVLFSTLSSDPSALSCPMLELMGRK